MVLVLLPPGDRGLDDRLPDVVEQVVVERVDEPGRLDKIVFGVAGAAIVAFIAWGLADAAQVTRVTTAMLTWVMTNLGWLFNGLAIVLSIYVMYPVILDVNAAVQARLEGDAIVLVPLD